MSIKFTFKEVYRGDNKNWNITFVDSKNNPIDLSNRTIYFTAKVSKSDLDINSQIKKEILVVSSTNAQKGIFSFNLTSLDTFYVKGNELNGELEEGVYQCDFRLSLPSNPSEIILTLEGVIEIEQPVTLIII